MDNNGQMPHHCPKCGRWVRRDELHEPEICAAHQEAKGAGLPYLPASGRLGDDRS